MEIFDMNVKNVAILVENNYKLCKTSSKYIMNWKKWAIIWTVAIGLYIGLQWYSESNSIP